MTKVFLTVFNFIILLSSCKTSTNQFGQEVIEATTDTTEAKQAIFKIKNLDNTIFDSASFVGIERIAIMYRLFKPNRQKTIEKYPLVVVFHGSGAIGTDNSAQLGILAKLFASPDNQQQYPAYVLAPQFSTRSSDYAMDASRNLLYSTPRPCLNVVFQLIDSLKSTLNIDQNKIYVVGFSMGGSTVINALAARPEFFAAGISISGIPQFDKIKEIEHIPIWLIHGMDDTENPIYSDEQFYNELDKNIRFWKIEATGHDNIFTSQILGETLPEWLFNQEKNEGATNKQQHKL